MVSSFELRTLMALELSLAMLRSLFSKRQSFLQMFSARYVIPQTSCDYLLISGDVPDLANCRHREPRTPDTTRI
jgi:hypothetical protein